MRLKVALLVVSVLLIAGVAWVASTLAGRGFSARENPSWLEEFLARNARKIATPAGAKEKVNPIQPTEENLAAARAHWVDHCALCHALNGSGATPIGQNLYPPAPDLRDALTQNLSDGELFYIITNGVRLTGMPAWGSLHADEETWQLVTFIRRLPRLTPEELRLLEQQAGAGGGAVGSGDHQHGPSNKEHRH